MATVSEFDQFAIDGLEAHNEFRRMHGTPDLVLNKQLCELAQEWADHCAQNQDLAHRPNNKYGENVYYFYSSDSSRVLAARDVVKNWYDEIKDHSFNTEKINTGCLHFTQVIWSASKELGMAMSKNSKGETYVVANYDPRGNFMNQFIKNVPPLLDSPEKAKAQDTANSSKSADPVASETKNSAGEFDQFAVEGLEAHNELRRMHGTPDLKLNKQLCEFAQEWADHCAQNEDLAHRPNNKYGENVYYFYSSDPSHVLTARDAVKNWYDEIKDHTFNTEKVNTGCLHFTQVIWSASKELGMAMSKNSKGETYVVANYDPGGNFMNQFIKNVPPLLGSPEKAKAQDSANSSKGADPVASETKDAVAEFDQFALEGLAAHNEFRRKHGTPDLKLNKQLCEFAQEWADHCAQNEDLAHRPNNKYGENVYYFYSSDPSHVLAARDVVNNWYDEIKDYTFNTEKVNTGCLHFTQVIWSASKELGMAMSKSSKGKTYVVANYDPRGNFMNQFINNVPPLLSSSEKPKAQDTAHSSRTTDPVASETKNAVGEFDQFAVDGLTAHNEFRRKHGTSDLKLNKQLCEFAQEWADHCAQNADLAHRPNNKYGENVYYFYSSDPSHVLAARDVVKNWYDEIKDYTFNTEKVNTGCLHFTQVVWSASKELGMAMSKNSKGEAYVVANYDPRGNSMNQFINNVPPLLSSPEKAKASVTARSSKDIDDVLSEADDVVAEFDQFALEGLAAHNEYRRKHGTPDLILSKKLCDFAQEWADHCAQNANLAHRPNNKYGENVYYSYSSDPNHVPVAGDVVKSWYDEIKNHTFNTEKINTGCLHFTQVIWSASKELGIAKSKNSKGETYVVANYDPRGNFMKQFSKNVPPLLSSSEKAKPQKETAHSSKNTGHAASGTKNAAVGEFNQFALDGLAAHNEYRRKHGTPDLKLNKKLCDFAQEWAKHCAQKSELAHRPNNKYGENVYYNYSSDPSHVPAAKDAVKSWYDEIKDYTFGTEKINTACLHFTQVIWSGSKELGMAMSKNSKGKTYVVANYDPRGNFMSQFVSNVPKPL